MSARRPGVRAAITAVLAVMVVAGLGIGGTVWFLSQSAGPPPTPTCAAQVGDLSGQLSPEQADNAALISAVVLSRGLPARAATIALATAMQESSLRNIDYGDRDSLGLFQQRPSQGWGTAEQIMDPVYSTGAFLDKLVQVPGYTTMAITDAAQAVQRSAYPLAYADHESKARAFAAALTGNAQASLACTALERPAAPGSPAQIATRVAHDFGALPVTQLADGVQITASLPGLDATSAGLAVARWAVAVAASTGISAVHVGSQTWDRDTSTWSAATGALAPGEVRVFAATAAS